MTVRFLADEDIDVDIIHGLRSREPAIDILDVKSSGLRGSKDPFLLELAFQENRVVITYDRNTMTRHVRDRFTAGKSTAGVFVLPNGEDEIGGIIEYLLLVWAASEAEEWRNRVEYIRSR